MSQTSFSMQQVSSAARVVEFSLEERPCDSCGGVDLEEIWTNDYVARTRTSAYHFKNRNVLCRHCGFAFVSPCPSDAELHRYYGDSFAHYSGQPPSSDVELRAEVIRRRVPAGLCGLEIGGNQLTRDPRIRNHFRTFSHVEPNGEIGAQYAHVDEVPSGSVDAVVHYYVLEHAPDPRRFLRTCHRVLRPGGVMICEVPDMKLYPRLVGELLWWEHLTHFSVRSLARVASAAGFRLVEVGHRNCSNDRGMLAVFAREDQPISAPSGLADPIEYLDAGTSMREGVLLVERFNAMLESTRTQMHDAKGPVTVWGANGIAQRLFASPLRLDRNAVVVDDDPRKADFLDGIATRLPGDVLDHLRGSSLLVITSARLAERIGARARSLAGPDFAPAIRVVDYDLPVAG